jgi:hypothetical protein
MAFMDWATHVLQWLLQKDAFVKAIANLKNNRRFEVSVETYRYEVGIASNRIIDRYGELFF